MKNLNNQSPFVIAFLLLAVFAGIMLLPLEGLLLKMSLSDFQAEYGSLAVKMSSLFLLALLIIRMFKIKVTAGLSSAYPWKAKWLNLIPIYLIGLGVMGILSKDLSQVQLSNLLLLLVACLSVGFAEEFMFRGIFQSLFLKKSIDRKHGIFLSVFIPALFFGLFHLINLVKGGDVLPTLVQVVFAVFIGFFFGALVLKTNKIIPVAITHGLINFVFLLEMLPGLKVMESTETAGPSAASFAPIILTLPLFIIGLLVIRKVNKEKTQEKVLANQPMASTISSPLVSSH